MADKNAYAGKFKNTGVQHIPALFNGQGKAKKATATRGKDLRSK